ncbi:hypothetical protein [Acinetobacter sp.]|uniref:hypothetical protein n=1 Tax=Acinetobacter sp. TaxID=472 RepID=UPI0035AEA63F
MKEWISKSYTKVDCAFSEFPKLKYLSLFYVVLVVLAAFLFEPILVWAYGFSYFGSYPLQNFIAENAHWLLWGKLVVPVVLAILFYCDVSDRHDEKYLKKYKQLPKWV